MKLIFRKSKHKKQSKKQKQSTTSASSNSNSFNLQITKNLEENINSIKTMLGEPGDLTARKLTGKNENQTCAILYIGGLVDDQLVQNNILKTIQENIQQSDQITLDTIYQDVIAISDTQKTKQLDDVSYALLSGSTIFYMDGSDSALLISAKGGVKRSIEEPQSEALIRGPREPVRDWG